MRDFIITLRNKIWYAAFIALLALISAGMLAYEFFAAPINEETLQIMAHLDLIIAYVFLGDFLIGFFFAPRKILHLKENWLDLLGSIPLSDSIFRAMRIFRFVRLVRLVRAANVGLNIQGSIAVLRKRYQRRKERKRLQTKQKVS